MLGARRAHRWDLMLLMRARHPQIGAVCQIRPASACSPREVRNRIVGILPPGQVRAGRARLLAPPTFHGPVIGGSVGRRRPARQVIGRRRHRRVRAVTRQQSFQPVQPRPQLAVVRPQRLQLARLLLQPTRLTIKPDSLIPHTLHQLRARQLLRIRHPETSPAISYASNEPSSPALQPQTPAPRA